jgi:hypothetical protein
MAGKGRLSKKGAMNRGQLRELLTEQLIRAVESRGFVSQMFEMLDQIKDPDKRLRCSIELLKFAVPQLASQRVEVVNEETPVTQIVFSPATTATPTLKAVDSKE